MAVKNTRILILVSIVLLIAVSLACGSSDAAATDEPDEAAVEEPAEEEVAEEPAEEVEEAEAEEAAVEEPAEEEPAAGDLSITALQIVDPATPGTFTELDEGMHLVAVELLFENLSGEIVSVSWYNASLVDDSGVVTTSEWLGADDLKELPSVNLYPGERVSGWITFSVPDGALPAKIKYEPSMWSDEVYDIDLAAAAPVEYEPTDLEAPGALGETASANGVELTVQEVVDPAEPGIFTEVEEGTRLVAFKILIKNVDFSDEMSVDSFSVYMVDDYGFVHTSKWGGTDGLEELEYIDIRPGEAAQGYVSFTIEEGRQPLYLYYALDWLDADVIVVAGAAE